MRRTALKPANLSRRAIFILLLASACLAGVASHASSLDIIGLTVLRATTTNLDGTGIPILQVETEASTSTDWEVNPAAVGLPAGNFVYYYNGASTNNFPNTLGTESWHGDSVGARFYADPGGVATNVAQVNNYEATYFAFTVIPSGLAINGRVVNQSFIATTNDQTALDPTYDTYAAQNNTLFVSAVGNGGPVTTPSTCYNGIGVGAYVNGTVYSSIGPTPDSTHRAKPDLTAPEGATSFSTPLVSGAAVILLQAALRGDGGTDTNSAADARVLKALLINGAIKAADWTNSSTSPLDARYGAGTVNVFESYEQLAGGKHAFIASTSVSTGGAHPPTSATNNVGSLTGWDFSTLTSGVTTDRINHYYFNLAGGASNAMYTATATLVWNRQAGQTSINDLNLYLYNTSNGNRVASSVSTVDNVEHLYIIKLPPGRYDLQVLKRGGIPSPNGPDVTSSETYALAFEFFSAPVLALAHSGGNIVLTWPVYPAGFALESTPSLTPPTSWTPASATPVIANNQNSVTISSSSGNQFFRLSR
ncbi:MAG TPA: S8 family serine peptidase [Verrucomicrobiae bacterium]|nr:S8 family serine peptidase [Verrucomicrobiae bacterium]